MFKCVHKADMTEQQINMQNKRQIYRDIERYININIDRE